jgi:3-deoxy-D-manno-octulosonate 8-phosphate phosphatase (KDO 8-P phosphatase)
MGQAFQRAKKIKLCIFDVDGILTSGNIVYGNHGIEYKSFHVRDGLGFKLLAQSDIQIAIISGRTSEAVKKRLDELKLTHIFLGQDEKLPIYEQLKLQMQLHDDEIAYMGDDLPDLPILSKVGLAITVADAPSYIQRYCHWTTHHNGGEGAVREACEFILKAQDKLKSVVDTYLA